MFTIRGLCSVVWLSLLRSRTSFQLLFASTNSVARNMSYSTKESGSEYAADYKVYFSGENGLVSPFHDIPIFADKEKNIYNMVVEIPRWTNAKMEISTTEPLNPIKQDVKKGKMRFVNNVFPYRGYIWNYGAIPQTWEDPREIDEHTKQKGDNDPIDVCEIGYKVAKRGEVKQVKILGAYALIDEGETDWKILTIDINDPLADKMNDIDDIKKHMPGLLEATHEWFKLYKIPAGKPANEFAFNGVPKDKEFATGIVKETHKFWQRLINKDSENTAKLACENVLCDGSPYKISEEEVNKLAALIPPPGEAHPIPMEVDNWHFLEGSKYSSVTEAVKGVCMAKDSVPKV